MREFGRVLRMVARRRWTLGGCLLSSLLVALLWGFNISTLYPMVEVIFGGRGAAVYVSEQAEQSEQLACVRSAEAGDYRRQLAATTDPAARRALILQIESAETLSEGYRRSGEWLRWIEPAAERYLPAGPYETLLLVIGVFVLATLVKLLALIANLMLVQELSQRVAMQIRELFFRRALRQDLEHFGETGSSQLTSRLTGDINDLAMGVSVMLGRMVREPLKMIVCLIGAGVVCWRLLLVTFIISPIVGLAIGSLSRSIRRSSRRVMEEMTQLYGMLSESFAGIRIVRAYHTEAFQRSRFRIGARKYYRKSMKVAFYNAATRFTSELLGTTVLCIGLLAGGYLVLNQETHLLGVRLTTMPLSVGEMILFFGFLIGASDPARKLTDVWSNLQRGIAASERLIEVIDAPVRVTEPEHPQTVALPHHRITLRDVAFRYPSGPEVLRDFNLEIPHGESLAVVGPNGSGKSTLVGLMCRFDDPSRGEICLDDVPLREMRTRDLRRRIGLVTQRTVIFEDTILNNIRYGSPRASDAEVKRAAERAHADEFIRTKTAHGYDSILGHDGAQLSGGQMQRIALARAFLRDPEILILDEATSQIDLESEQLIHEALAEFLVGRTGIMITHRPTTLALADRVAVIEAGQVSDCGSHAELLARNPFYRSLCGSPLRKSA
ncbi:ABC transporter ATP-binding protein [Candidatus Laterigemmans baculatus]|uniref:ABC transporter ATP-binding protein n=1 Tax=Candidatus Laterigemmans baculatus TaxID=2770505 RepID=UPI0013DAC922|nr:ABC transporter ATP-binding protein [Candidatus Laterigemmans baculatus]